MFSHIGYACQMTRATSINERDTFDDSQVSTAEADIRVTVGQKSGPALARRQFCELRGFYILDMYQLNVLQFSSKFVFIFLMKMGMNSI